jgi:hypothetical protein
MRAFTRSILALSAAVAAAAVLTGDASLAQGGGSQVIVRAVSRDGQPLLDLKPGEISIRVDGNEREVKALELKRPAETAAASPAAPAAPTPSPAPLPPPYAVNAGGDAGGSGGRELLLLVDDEGIAPGREDVVRQAITALVGTLTPADRVGLVAMKPGGLNVPPSTRHAAVIETLPKMIGTGSSGENAVNLACRTKPIFGTLEGLLRGAPPYRTLVFFSPGLAPVSADRMRTRGSDENNLCQIRSNDLEALSRAAAASAAEFIVVHHGEGLANSANLSSVQTGLENVAGTTGAEMVRLTGSGETAGMRIGRTAGFYYVATLEGDGSGPVRRVDARVSREGVRVTARPMSASSGETVKAGSPRDMIRVMTVLRDVTIRAAGFVSRMPPPAQNADAKQPGSTDLKVLALFEPDDPTVKLSAAIIGLFDEKGTLKAQWTAQPNELSGSPVIAALMAAPGRYRMRVAATDTSGKGGTTDYDLTVQLPEAPPLKMSNMLLGVGQGGFAPRLAFTAADAAAIGMIELYDLPAQAKIDTTFEILKGTEVMGSGQGTVGNGPGGARITYGGFGIATLEPGDYTMRATINVDGKQAGVATRTLRKLR